MRGEVVSGDTQKVWIVSFGGVGSKLVTRLIYPGASQTVLEERHVHWRHLRPDTQDDKFIYVFGDPRNTVISFFQRRETRHDNHGFMPPQNASVAMPKFVQYAVKNLESPHHLVPEDWDLDTYLRNTKHDIFDLDGHVKSWRDRQPTLDITFLKYGALWSAPDTLRALGVIPVNCTIPAFQPRRANWKALPEHQIVKLNHLYGPLVDYLDSLPDVF